MQRIRRMTKTQLENLGGTGQTKAELVASVEGLYTLLNATDINDFTTKSNRFIPRIKSTPTNLKKAIKQKYNIRYLKNQELQALTERYNADLKNENFEEIIRIARLNDGFLTYERNGENVIYRVNENNLLDLRRALSGIEVEEVEGSDEQLLLEIRNNITNIRGRDIQTENNMFIDEDPPRRRRQMGGFLLKGHTLPFDFSRYGLFNKDQNPTEYHKYNCLFHALEAGGLSQDKLENLKINFYQRDIAISTLHKVADLIKANIILRHCNDPKNRKTKYGNYEKDYNINIIEDHYFIQEDTEFTSFVLENYELVKDEKNFMNIVGIDKNNKFRHEYNKTINSKRLVEIVLKNYSYTIDRMDVINTVYHHKIKSRVENLEYPLNYVRRYVSDEEKKQKEELNKRIEKKETKLKTVEKTTKKPKSGVLRVFFDFETVKTDNNLKTRKNDEHYEELEHKARELTYVIGEQVFYYAGYDCGKHFIDHILKIQGYQEIHLIAHNAGFDFNFIAQYLPNIQICKIESRFIYALTYSTNANIYVKDSRAFIRDALKEFPKIFKLQDHKLDFDHEWVKFSNLNEKGLLINDFIKATEKTPKELINENGEFNVREYSRHYNLLDVKVLQQGYNTLAKWAEDLGTNIDKVFTISSLAKVYASNQGCFEGCYELSGVPQAFISQAIMGGRVMTQENKQILLENVKVATLDANSLYPSAMISMDGFLKGKPKVISQENLNKEFLDKQDYYYIDIKIIKVGRFLKMPLLAVREETSINYTNDCEGKILTVGKIYLEDLIKFQEIEYEIIRGYYFDEGFNTKIRSVINYLYNTRNILKKQGNPAEAMYKLIMNSIYGKCLQKPKEKKLVIQPSTKEMLKYLVRNKMNIEMAEKVANCDKWLIREYKEINTDFNYVHIGGHILDTSKRIMNEAITLAEENDINIYYTDTDSMHLDLEKINLLKEKYFERYQKNLINNELLGFKQDFGKDAQGNELYATKCVFLGKKTYIDVLNDGHNHCRAKGITQNALEYEAKKQNKEIFEVYKDRYHGKTQTFDLTCGGSVFTAKQKINFSFVQINDFTRKF